MHKPHTSRSERFEKARRFFTYPMVALTFLLLGIIILRGFFDFSENALSVLNVVDWLIWLAFLIELVTLTYLSKKKLHYLVTHWYDILIVLLPAFRLVRLVRIFSLLEVERIGQSLLRFAAYTTEGDYFFSRIIPLITKGILKLRELVKAHHYNYIFSVFVVAVGFLGSLTALVERSDPQANILTVYDGIWWSIVTMTTVGYGDLYPVTWPGKILAVLVMTIGITAFYLVAASIATFLMGEKDRKERNELQQQLDRLESRLTHIQEQLTHPQNKQISSEIQ